LVGVDMDVPRPLPPLWVLANFTTTKGKTVCLKMANGSFTVHVCAMKRTALAEMVSLGRSLNILIASGLHWAEIVVGRGGRRYRYGAIIWDNASTESLLLSRSSVADVL
jgi:hypothetical protein